MEYGTNGQPSPRVIETASATTSPDNANSGNTAYLIAAAGLVLAIMLSMSLGSCASATMKSLYYLVEDDLNYYVEHQELLDPYDSYDLDDYDNLDDLYEHLIEQDGMGSQARA